jgi:hypothetical protein
MKISKTIYLLLGILFTVDFIYSIFDPRETHELFFWDVNMWIYRIYKLLLVLLFLKIYMEQKKNEKINDV